MKFAELRQIVTELPTLERIFCLAPAILVLGGGIGGLVACLGIFMNLAVVGQRLPRGAQLICSAIIFALSLAVYVLIALYWRQYVPLQAREALGVACLVAGGLYFPFEFARGIIKKSAPDPVTGFLTRVAHSDKPWRFFAGMTVMGLLTLCVALIAFAFFFLPHA